MPSNWPWPKDQPSPSYEPVQKQPFLSDDDGELPRKGYRPQVASNVQQTSKRLYLVSALNLLVLSISLLLAAHSYRAKAALLSNKDNAMLRASDWFCKFPVP